MAPRASSKKLALLIGINYRGSSAPLGGCLNDVLNMKRYLLKNSLYRKGRILTVLEKRATRKNILYHLRKVLWLCRKGFVNHVYVHYSGHGTYVRSFSEKDGRDEAIVPFDGKIIRDDELHALFAQRLPRHVRCFMTFDSCYSGTILDLPYRYPRRTPPRKRQTSRAFVVTLSGCRDDQVSWDTGDSGALTKAFLDALRRVGPRCTFWTLLGLVRNLLKFRKLPQVPQLYSSRLLGRLHKVYL